MARLTHYALCEAINTTQEGKPVLISPLADIVMKYVPGLFSFCVSFGITDFDISRDNQIQITILDSDGNIVIDMNAVAEAGSNTEKCPSIALGFEVRNAEFTHEGKYVVRILVNGEALSDLFFRVRRVD